MKTLTIKQPWATLIAYGHKRYEFRSWKTKYRGEIYIHAGSGADTKYFSHFESLNLQFPSAKILAKANLVDCIELNEELGKRICEENPFVYGHKSIRTGYAWVLEDVQLVNLPEKVTGRLSIWNYYTPEEIMALMEQVEYGWLDYKGNKQFEVDETNSENYRLQSPLQVIENAIGVCWDQVELERYYFKNSGWNIKTYFLCYYTNDKCPSHTFLTFEKNNKYYWFEHSYKNFRGIHEYNSVKELLLDVIDKFIKNQLQNDCIRKNLLLREYTKPKSNLSALEFYHHCEINNLIELEKKT